MIHTTTIIMALFVGFIFGVNNRKFIKIKPKYRVGRKQGRSILEIETGYEFLVFEKGRESDCKEYCEYLNNK